MHPPTAAGMGGGVGGNGGSGMKLCGAQNGIGSRMVQPRFAVTSLFAPPYDGRTKRLIDLALRITQR